MGIILDTTAYSAYCRGNYTLKTIIDSTDSLFLPSVVLGELFYGFYKGGQLEANMSVLTRFLNTSRVTVIDIDAKIAKCYGALKYQQNKAGQTIDDNDLWIAATCIQLQQPLVSLDTDFHRVTDKSFEMLPI